MLIPIKLETFRIKSVHEVPLFAFDIVKLLSPFTCANAVSVNGISSLSDQVLRFPIGVRSELSALHPPDFRKISGSVIILIHVKPLLVRVNRFAILYEFTPLRHHREVVVSLLAINRLIVQILVIGLSDHRLGWESFDQMIRRVGNLLVVKRKHLILLIGNVHVG